MVSLSCNGLRHLSKTSRLVHFGAEEPGFQRQGRENGPSLNLEPIENKSLNIALNDQWPCAHPMGLPPDRRRTNYCTPAAQCDC
jgi:hypothetical protein